MDASPLDQFHNAGDKDPFAVAHSVYLYFFAADIMIHEYRPALVDGLCRLEITPQVRLFGDDLHGTPAQDKAGADQHRVADFFCSFQAFCGGSDGTALGLRDSECFEEFLKQIPVLRLVDGVAVRANDPDAPCVERIRQIDRRLPAERYDDTVRIFHLDHVHDIFHAQWFKIQLVRAGIVC